MDYTIANYITANYVIANYVIANDFPDFRPRLRRRTGWRTSSASTGSPSRTRKSR
jgi:hypothetical protein